jgi:hypothetical protein
MMTPMIGLLLLLASQEVVIRTVESPSVASLAALEVPDGEIGVVVGAAPEVKDLLSAAGFTAAPFERGRVAVIADAKEAAGAKAEVVVLVTSLSREQAATILRETPRIALCIVSGRGGGDPEPLKIGTSWMVQAPGDGRLWGRIDLRGGSVTNRFSAPDGKPSEKVAAAKKKMRAPLDALRDVRESMKAGAKPETATEPETANRACRLRIHAASERGSYGARSPSAGKKFLILDVSFENTIPMTLVQSNQVPTIYKIKELGDHLYLVVNGDHASRLLPDAKDLPGHVAGTNFMLDRLGSRIRGNLVYEIPSEGVRALDLRFYDYAHGPMALTLRAGAPPETKPKGPLQENEILEMGLFRAERAREIGGKKAPDGMTFMIVELRARSKMFTEGDATAFDPKAKPGEKLQIGTVSDWTEARKHLHVLLDGEFSYGPEDLELGEAPRFLPDLLTGGLGVFLVPEKAQSVEVRCDFPNARLPDGKLVHPKALSFVVEGKRPDPADRPALAEVDDDVFKVAVTGQSVVPEFAGVKAPAGSIFLVVDVSVKGAGKAGEMFQTVEQLRYATEKGAQVGMSDAAFRGPRPPAKLLLVPTGEKRSFQAVFLIPVADRRPRLAYRGVTKAATLELKPLEGAAARACPKCKRAAEPGEKFCSDCGTKLNP